MNIDAKILKILAKQIQQYIGNSLAVQWLGLCALTAEGLGSMPGGN